MVTFCDSWLPGIASTQYFLFISGHVVVGQNRALHQVRDLDLDLGPLRGHYRRKDIILLLPAAR